MKKLIVLMTLLLCCLGANKPKSLSQCASSLAAVYPSANFNPEKAGRQLSSVSPFGKDHHNRLALAIIAAESSFDRYAVSSVGAVGLMQMTPIAVVDASQVCLMPTIAKADWYTPWINMRLGLCYMEYLSRNTSGVDELVVVYNGGFRQLANLRAGRKLATQTEQYRDKVLKIYRSHCQ